VEKYQPLALLVTRIYGATFVALGIGWALVSAAVLALGAPWGALSGAYFMTAAAYFVAGVTVMALSRAIAKFSIRC
jgi:hypothetical protein